MDNRIFRFENCDKEFYPYIVEVLNKIPPDVKEQILDDPGFEILGILH